MTRWDLHAIEELVTELAPDAFSVTASRAAVDRVKIDVRGLNSEQRLQLALKIGNHTGLVAYVEEKCY